MAEKKMIENLSQCFETEEEKEAWYALRAKGIQFDQEAADKAQVRRIARDARELQILYRCCPQTTSYPLMMNLGLGSKEVFKGVSALAGGLYEERHICGCLLGCMVVISLEFGRADFSEPGGPREGGLSNFTLAERFTRELYRRFEEQFGTVICRELLENHFGKSVTPVERTNPMEVERAKSGELYSMISTYCCNLVEKSAEITADIILRERRAKMATA